MKRKNELNYTQLKKYCDPNSFSFKTTKELTPTYDGIGQDRGIKSLEFGLNVDVKGYNLYIEGPSGVGKTMYAKKYLDKIAPTKKKPCDWCYIYNFDNPNEPIAVSLPAGQGKEFKDAMDTFIKDIRVAIKNTFNNDDFEKEKKLKKQDFEAKREKLLEELNNESIKYGFQVKASNNGIYMLPVIDGKTLEEDEFDKLDEATKQEFEDKSSIVQNKVFDTIGRIKILEKEEEERIQEWKSNIALFTINVHINFVKQKFKKNKKINTFLNNIKQDILRNISYYTDADTNKQPNVPVPPQMEQKKPWLNYRVNLFIDNSKVEGAPIIMDSNYSYHNIFGKLEYENYYGSLKTDYTMLKPGLMHLANGGYIIFQAKDLLANQLCYENLKRILRVKEINIENTADQRSSMVMVSLKP